MDYGSQGVLALPGTERRRAETSPYLLADARRGVTGYQWLPMVTNGYRLVTRIGGEDLELFGLDGTEIGEKNLSWRDCNEKSGKVRKCQGNGGIKKHRKNHGSVEFGWVPMGPVGCGMLRKS